MPHNANTQQQGHSAKNNDAFVQRLQALAQEQRELVEHGMLPDWLGPINAAVARNALPVVLIVSLVIALVLFVVYFQFFYGLESRLI